MKKLFLMFAAAVCALGASAAENIAPLTPELVWEGTGKAVSLPQVTQVKGPENLPAVRIEVTSKGKYQGSQATFKPAVDLSKYAYIEFYIRHNITRKNRGKADFAIAFKGKTGLIYGNFVTPTYEWNKITLPLDKTSFKGGSGNTVNWSLTNTMNIYPYSALDNKGEFIEIANVRLLPPTTGTAKIKVSDYIYASKPNAGENGKTLTDGVQNKNVEFHQYSDDPDITFDLGGRFALDELNVYSNASPSHNFSELTVFTSFDKVDWHTAGVIVNDQQGSEERLIKYSLKKGDNPIVGRYVRLKAIRVRSDFFVKLSEVEFSGHTPSNEEIAKAAEMNYDNGIAMPPRSSKDYEILQNGDLKLYISRSNGVVNGVFYGKKLLAERLTAYYMLQSREKDMPSDGNKDVVKKIIRNSGNSITVITQNPELKGLTFKRTWSINGKMLTEKVEVINDSMQERMFLRSGIQVILEQNFRKNCFYELPSECNTAGMIRIPANEIQFDRKVGAIPHIALENGQENLTVWHMRYRFDKEYTPMTVTNEESNLQIFKPNGYRIVSATIVPLDKKVQSYENIFRITDGRMLKAYDEYLDLPEVRAFYQTIKRAPWLRDVRAIAATGWNASYRTSGINFFSNYRDFMSHRGSLVDGMLIDTDGIWGDYLTQGDVRGWFGNRQTPQELKEKLVRLRAVRNDVKLCFYTWLWSAFPWSTPVKNHPEWFITKLRNGGNASYFPGVNVNYLRFIGIEESRKEIADQIVNFVNFYNQDGWYLDGGGAGSYAKDYNTMRIDHPLGWIKLYADIRQRMHATDPDKFVFFNNPQSPQGDFGFMESFGGALTNEWRKGATIMWKFKMYSYRDPLHYPVYIYWLRGIDGAFHNYLSGIGILPAGNSRGFFINDLAFIAARYEIRQAQITDAAVQPDWRFDWQENLECMALTQGRNGWIFMQNHDARKAVKSVSADLAKLNITDSKRPVYAWLYTIKNAKKTKFMFGEKAIAKAYKDTNWIAERAVTGKYLGACKYTPRFEYKVSVQPGEAQVLMLSQVPAVVMSIESEPSHYLLAGQPGIELNGFDGKFEVNNEYKTAEIGLILNGNELPAEIKLNGKSVPFRVHTDNNFRAAVITVPNGKSIINMSCQKAAAVKTASLDVKLDGKVLTVKVEPANAAVEIRKDKDLVLSRTGSFSITLPDTAANGKYYVHSHALKKPLVLKKIAKVVKLHPVLGTFKDSFKIEKLDRKVNNIELYSAATAATDKCAYASVDVNKLKLTAGTLREYETHFNTADAALEFSSKRYLKLRMTSGFVYANKYGLKPRRHAVRHDHVDVFGGIIFDFNTAKGYTMRSAAGLGVQNEKRAGKRPNFWGKKGKCDRIYALDNIMIDPNVESKTVWIDLQTLGAPADWNGKLFMTLHLEHICADHKFSVEILESSDSLPAGAKALNPMQLGVILNKVLTVPRFNGDWAKIPVLGNLSPLRNSMVYFNTTVKMAYDDKNLYIYYEAEEDAKRKLNSEGGTYNQPWEGDGVEFFVGIGADSQRIIHMVLDVAGVAYIENVPLVKAAGAKSSLLTTNPVKHTFKRSGGKWVMTLTVPWSLFGSKPAKGELRPFNLMRNRLEQGQFGQYTLAPGKRYMSEKQYQFKLAE